MLPLFLIESTLDPMDHNEIPYPRIDWLNRLHGITIDRDVNGPHSVGVDWQPGDSTSYLVTVSAVSSKLARRLGCYGPYAWMITRWYPGSEACAMAWPPDGGYLAPSYLLGKGMGSEYTVDVIAVILNALIPTIDSGIAPSLLCEFAETRQDVPGFRAP